MNANYHLLLEKIVCLLLILSRQIKYWLNSVGLLIISERYEEMVELLEDTFLFYEAERRMKDAETEGFLTHEQMLAALGINQSELDDADVEIN